MAPIEEIYEKYYKDVYRYLLALSKDNQVAQDVMQETFLKAMKSVGGFKGDCDIRVWLCQIAKNTYYTYAKKHSREYVELEEAVSKLAGERDFIKDMVDKEEAKKIHQIVHGLNEPYKEVFNLRIFGELPFKEIAELFGKTESWARVTFHRARVLILEKMEEEK